MNRLRRLASGLVVCAMANWASAAHAEFPDHAVHFVVSSNAGGGIDTVARMIAARLSEKWHQPVVVDNKPGSNTMVAESFTAHAAPDGYTIMFNNAQRTVNAAQSRSDAGYDMVNGFAAVTQVGAQAQMVVSNPKKLPVTSLPELVALAKAQPNKLSYGDYGRSSTADLGTKLFMQKTGTEILEIPYKTQAEAMVALLGGEIDMTIAAVLTAAPQVKAGTLTALAVTDDVRSTSFPNVPTVAESLGLKSFVFTSWYGVFVPAGTPKDLIAKLNEDFASVIKLPEIQDPLTRDGFRIVANKPEEFEKIIKEETAIWRGVAEAFPSK
jgi:tripartite-type tricarboxylate transporter receptor subunit TctC